MKVMFKRKLRKELEEREETRVPSRTKEQALRKECQEVNTEHKAKHQESQRR